MPGPFGLTARAPWAAGRVWPTVVAGTTPRMLTILLIVLIVLLLLGGIGGPRWYRGRRRVVREYDEF